MNKNIFYHTSLFAAALIAAFIVNVDASAAAPPPAPVQRDNPTGQALEIAPPVLPLAANPGDIVTAEINIRDVSTVNLVVSSVVNDFSANGEDGLPKIDIDNKEPSPYSIKSWIDPLPQLQLKPKSLEKLPIKIRVPANASPGGYYGVIRFTAIAPGMNTNGVSLSASLGTLVFLRVNGEAKEGMEIVEFSTNDRGKSTGLFETIPISFTNRIKNTGNVFERPVGRIALYDMFNKNVANVNINLEQRTVLPQSIRNFPATLDNSSIGNMMLFGKYTAKLTFTYGEKKQTVTEEITFWVIPYKLIGAIILVIILAIFLIRFALKRYTEKILNSSRNRSRRR